MPSNRPRRFAPSKGEILDRTPVAKPLGFSQPPSIRDQVLAAIRYHTEMARTEGAESFEEADDFDIGDDAPPEFGRGHELPDDVVNLAAWNDKSQRSAALAEAHKRFLQGQNEPAPDKGAAPPSPGGKGSQQAA